MAEDELTDTTSVRGEGDDAAVDDKGILQLATKKVVVEKRLTFEDASRCLNTLGKDETGMRYAYLMITATDRNLTDVSVILSFKHLLFVDVSENELTLDSLQVLAEMPFLIMLKAERNRVASVALKLMPYLQLLRLSRNVVLETTNINQPALECLELSYNQIYMTQFDADGLIQLKQLEIRGNFLPELGGNYPPTLEVIYLAENRISRICESTLSKLVNLKILHLRENYIRKLDGFTSALINLKYLNVRDNRITKFRQFRKLQCLPTLETLVVLQNPVGGDADEGEPEEKDDEGGDEEEKEDITRIPLLALLPNLKRINKVPVTLEEREEVAEMREEKLEEIMAEDSSDDDGFATGDTTTTAYSTDAEY